MSLKVTSYVWEHSKQKGSALLLMLAIADFADDDGVAFPGLARLAKKARTSRRNVQYTLDKLVEAGALAVDRNAGALTAHGLTNRYTVITPWNKGVKSVAPDEAGCTPGVKPVAPQGVKPVAPKQSEEQSEEQSVKNVASIIKAWLDASGTIDKAAYGKKVNRVLAEGLLENGVTPEQVKAYIEAIRQDRFWADKGISLTTVSKNIMPWLKAHPQVVAATSAPTVIALDDDVLQAFKERKQ